VLDDEDWEQANVVLCAHDKTIDATKLERATRALWAGAAFYITAVSPYFAAQNGRALGLSGLVGAGLTHVTGVEPTLTGKPSPAVMELAGELLGVAPGDLAVVGDDLDNEHAMARAAGAISVVVLTGTCKRPDVDALSEPPDVVVDDLRQLLEQLG
jgi:ribonucleotide monophosphatase NagD (HAD superfamily)